tara:strand:+ start:90 stop:221 length:132 start_codon:yes stop_codon:yes gene_type:complete
MNLEFLSNLRGIKIIMETKTGLAANSKPEIHIKNSNEVALELE